MKIEKHISLAHLHFLSLKCDKLLFICPSVWKFHLCFVWPDWPETTFIFLLFGPGLSIKKIISLLPARPAGEIISHLPGRVWASHQALETSIVSQCYVIVEQFICKYGLLTVIHTHIYVYIDIDICTYLYNNLV